MPEDIACESEGSPEDEHERGQTDDGGDAPGSQDVSARSLLLRREALRWHRIVHGSASCHGVDCRDGRVSRRWAVRGRGAIYLSIEAASERAWPGGLDGVSRPLPIRGCPERSRRRTVGTGRG